MWESVIKDLTSVPVVMALGMTFFLMVFASMTTYVAHKDREKLKK